MRDLTPALAAAECWVPETRVEAARARIPSSELAPHLETAIEARLRPTLPPLGNVTDWATTQLLGASRPHGSARLDELSHVLAAGLLATQLLSDLSLEHRHGLEAGFAWRVAALDLAAHALAQATAGGLASLVDACAPNHDGEPCVPTLRPSPHATLGFTSAALTCLHQQMVGDGELGACAGTVAMAATLGVVRGLSHEHDLGDIAVSAAVGLVAGYLLPFATFYAFGAATPARRERPEVAEVQTWVSPMVSGEGLGLSALGTF